MAGQESTGFATDGRGPLISRDTDGEYSKAGISDAGDQVWRHASND
jgi:hypothetical protein